MNTLQEKITEQKENLKKIEEINKKFPNLREYKDRWSNLYLCTKDVNTLVNEVYFKHNCGCCEDSPLEAWTYINIENKKIYSDPPNFTIGEKIPYYFSNSEFEGGEKAYDNWENKLIENNIPQNIIDQIQDFFNENDPNIQEDLMYKNIFKSKWGYHPCDKETFQQLKKLNYWLLLAKKKAANWHRWNRKDKKYQIKTEPETCPIFSEIRNLTDLKWGVYTNKTMFNRTTHSFWIKHNVKNDHLMSLDHGGIQYDYNNKKVLNGQIYRYIPEKHGKFIEIKTYRIEQAYQNAKIPRKKTEDVIQLEINKEDILLLYLSAKKLYK